MCGQVWNNRIKKKWLDVVFSTSCSAWSHSFSLFVFTMFCSRNSILTVLFRIMFALYKKGMNNKNNLKGQSKKVSYHRAHVDCERLVG